MSEQAMQDYHARQKRTGLRVLIGMGGMFAVLGALIAVFVGIGLLSQIRAAGTPIARRP